MSLCALVGFYMAYVKKFLITFSSLFFILFSTLGVTHIDDTDLVSDIDSALGSSFDDEEFPVILSATRLKQPRNETPAAMTVIDQQTIKELGIRTLPEVFRLVPGLLVGYERGHTAEVGYHTLAGENTRHLQVLVDGRSIYQPALARILWQELPLAIEKIARIEIIRGPNTAVYGANSYLAVINIITYTPDDQIGSDFKILSGNKGIQDNRFHYAQKFDSVSYSVQLGTHSDDGFDLGKNEDERFDHHDTHFLAADLNWQLGLKKSLRFQLGLSNSDNQIDDLDEGEVDPYHIAKVASQFFQIDFSHDTSENSNFNLKTFFTETDIEESWTTAAPAPLFTQELFDLYTLDASYTQSLIAALLAGQGPPIPSDPAVFNQALLFLTRLNQVGTTNVQGEASQNLKESRFDVEAQWTQRFNQQFRMVYGASYRVDKVNSESYFAGIETKDIFRLFANAEFELAPHWLTNFGALYENDNRIGEAVSPRLALNWLASDYQTYRLIYATANRSPDLFEQSANRSYLVRNLRLADQTPVQVNPGSYNGYYYQHSQAKDTLDFEDIESWELGWYFQMLESGITIDVRLFKEKLTNLLEGETSIANFELTNIGHVDVTGSEVQMDWKINSDLRWWLALSNAQQTNASNNAYVKKGADSTVSSVFFYNINSNLSTSLGYFHIDDWYARFERWDASIRYVHQFSEVSLETQLIYQHRADSNFLLDRRSRYQDPDKIYVSVGLKW